MFCARSFAFRITKERKLPKYQAAKWIKETTVNQQSGMASSSLNDADKGHWKMFMMCEMKQAGYRLVHAI